MGGFISNPQFFKRDGDFLTVGCARRVETGKLMKGYHGREIPYQISVFGAAILLLHCPSGIFELMERRLLS
jgi:hypothetical protein